MEQIYSEEGKKYHRFDEKKNENEMIKFLSKKWHKFQKTKNVKECKEKMWQKSITSWNDVCRFSPRISAEFSRSR